MLDLCEASELPNQARFCPKFCSTAYVPDFQPRFIQVAIFECENLGSMNNYMKKTPMVMVVYDKKYSTKSIALQHSPANNPRFVWSPVSILREHIVF